MGRLATITRRTFLVGAAVVAGGAAFGYYKYKQPFDNPLEDDLADGESTLNAYVKIGTDNTITIIAPRAEMGQGVFTTLAALVAEELDVSLAQVNVEHGPGSPAYYNEAAMREGAPFPAFQRGMMAETMRSGMGALGKLLGVQITGGSSSTVDAYEKMRVAGAVAREMLKEAAAQKFGVAAASLKTSDGVITDPKSGKVLTYGEVALDAAKLVPPSDVALKPRSDWTLLGKSLPRKDMPAKVTGAPIFGIDVDLPEMLYATVRMNPQPGGGVKSFDDSAAKSMRGVKKIFQIDSPYGKGIAVIADNTWRAFQAADAVDIEWADGPGPRGEDDINAILEDAFTSQSPFSLREVGSPDTIFADAPREKIIEAAYDAPYLSHATMEPMNATARIKDGVLDIWAPNQAPTIMSLIGGRITGFDGENIHVHTTFMGGGFGRRLEPDFADYAIRVALEAEGVPVKVTWTREEDVTHGPYRPAAKGRYRAVLDENNAPKAVHGMISSQSIMAGTVARLFPGIPAGGPDNTMLQGAFDQPYDFANYRVDAYKAPVPGIDVCSWRSVGNSFNAFMQESFVDEMAHAAGQDPLEFRKAHMAQYPVVISILDKLKEISGWGTPLPAGKARGVAFVLAFGTWVGEVVQVADVDGQIKVEKVWCVADPGMVIDPKNFEAQMMSGIIFGLSAITQQKISFSDGAVEQSNFHDYDAMRMYQAPEIEIVILENSETMSGAGEPGVPPVMPALANAIFALNGKRIRRMPLNEEIDFV